MPCTPRRSTPLKQRTIAAAVDGKSGSGGDYDLIELVNCLQNKLAAGGHSLDISLPQIVVVGCQSAGKSSTLENIVGKEFLPRGTGVVTRRPTVVQLTPSKDDEEYAVFLHTSEKFYDFQKVMEEIREETLRNPGPTGFSTTPISIKIFSPNVLKLTLVDTPGLVKNVVGNESESSIEEVRNMVLSYIRQPNSLILAVSPANQDIANSDALNIAKIVDPERERTIGVLTKLDLMDDGTNASDVLENKKIFLSRGYVGVLNRSQKDIDEGKDVRYCLEKERQFFANTKCYSHLADRMGSAYLQKLLHRQLHRHIKESLPVVRKELSEKQAMLRKQLRDFDNMMGSELMINNGVQFYMIKLVQQFIDNVNVKIYGHSEIIDAKAICSGALMNYKLHTELLEGLKLPPIPNTETLMIIIANSHGIRNVLSVPSLALEAACRPLLEEYIKPLDQFVDCMVEMLDETFEESSSIVENYPTLKDEILFWIRTSIDQAAEETKDSLEKHMKSEAYFVNVYHPDFDHTKFEGKLNTGQIRIWNSKNTTSERKVNTEQSVLGSPEQIANCWSFQGTPRLSSCQENCDNQSMAVEMLTMMNENESAQRSAKLLAEMIEEYLRVVQKQVGDTAIKHIAYFLIKKVMDFVKGELVASLLQSVNIKDMLAECEEDFKKREEIQSTCDCVEEALIAVQSF